MEQNGNGSVSDRDTLFMLSGVALVVFGAGLILANPIARRYLGQFGVGNLAQAALPDLDRYLKLRAMYAAGTVLLSVSRGKSRALTRVLARFCEEIPMVPTRVNGVRCVIDTRVSQFTVQTFASGLGAAVTHTPKIAIRDWTGEAQFNLGNPGDFSLRVRVKAASLEVLDELRDDDRAQIHRVLTKDVLETARYPEIVYESSEAKAEKLRDDLYRVHVKGKLTFHGVSNDHAFVAQTALGTDSARAYGEFTLRPSDYSIGIASIAGGAWRLEDQLKFSFYMVARRREGER